MEQKFSLFLLERESKSHIPFVKKCWEFVATYDSLDVAKCHAENIKLKTIILTSY